MKRTHVIHRRFDRVIRTSAACGQPRCRRELSPANGIKQRLTALLVGALLCGGALAQTYTSLNGNWKAVWNIDGTDTIRFYLKLSGSGSSYSGTMDDLDDGYNNFAPNGISVSLPAVTFNFSSEGYVFNGTVNSDRKSTRLNSSHLGI